MAEPIAIALPKGRILGQVLPLLARAGVDLAPVIADAGRRLLLLTPSGDTVLLVKPSDVPTYVEHGIADIGIAGLDTLAEENRDLYQPVDLGIGACRLVVAAPEAAPETAETAETVDPRPPRRPGAPLRVATKYPRLTVEYYRRQAIQAQVIKLYGSVELGAITGLADQIVDVVESGETLRQNHLREVATILEITSRLIVHPASLKLKRGRIEALIQALRAAVDPEPQESGRLESRRWEDPR